MHFFHEYVSPDSRVDNDPLYCCVASCCYKFHFVWDVGFLLHIFFWIYYFSVVEEPFSSSDPVQEFSIFAERHRS